MFLLNPGPAVLLLVNLVFFHNQKDLKCRTYWLPKVSSPRYGSQGSSELYGGPGRRVFLPTMTALASRRVVLTLLQSWLYAKGGQHLAHGPDAACGAMASGPQGSPRVRKSGGGGTMAILPPFPVSKSPPPQPLWGWVGARPHLPLPLSPLPWVWVGPRPHTFLSAMQLDGAPPHPPWALDQDHWPNASHRQTRHCPSSRLRKTFRHCWTR